MPPTTVKICLRNSEHMDLRNYVSYCVMKSKRTLLVVGAGISTSAGIPDFRSTDGLYSLIKSKYAKDIANGQELFDAGIFESVEKSEIFYQFMGKFKKEVEKAHPTDTHQWIGQLLAENRLLRCFTQNIDGLELRTMTNDPCAESSLAILPRETDQATGQPAPEKRVNELVQLHGTLSILRCTFCSYRTWNTKNYVSKFLSEPHSPPECPSCKETLEIRLREGKRSIGGGILRPDIVLYREPSPAAENICKIIDKDAKRSKCLIVMGTSLRVPGCKALVKQLAKGVKSRNGQVIFVNKEPLSWSEWGKVFDWWVSGSCDDWVNHVNEFTKGYKKSYKSRLMHQYSCNFSSSTNLD